jgi:hypothetical protein
VHFLVTVAVLGYAVTAGAPAGAPRLEPAPAAANALAAAARNGGAEAIADGAAAAARAHAEGWVDAGALAFFARGASLVADGRKALERVELAAAEEALRAAEAVYAPELARPAVADAAATAALWHGVALFELARRADADAAFRRALALEPLVMLTEAQVRPDVARAFAQARSPRPKTPLKITLSLPEATAAELLANPPRARVDERVDGQAVEIQPGARPEVDVTPGEHLVMARLSHTKQYASQESHTEPYAKNISHTLPYAELIDVPATGREVTIALAPDRDADALDALAEQPSEEGVNALLAALPVDETILLVSSHDLGATVFAAQRVRPGCATATLLGPRTDELWRRVEAADCRAGQPIDVLQAEPIAHPHPAPSLVNAPPVQSRPPAWRKPWLWVGLVGALGAGVVVVATVVPRAATYTVTLNAHSFGVGASP